jgi:hypothetical protein
LNRFSPRTVKFAAFDGKDGYVFWAVATPTPMHQIKRSFFASFFSKKEVLPFLNPTQRKGLSQSVLNCLAMRGVAGFDHDFQLRVLDRGG